MILCNYILNFCCMCILWPHLIPNIVTSLIYFSLTNLLIILVVYSIIIFSITLTWDLIVSIDVCFPIHYFSSSLYHFKSSIIIGFNQLCLHSIWLQHFFFLNINIQAVVYWHFTKLIIALDCSFWIWLCCKWFHHGYIWATSGTYRTKFLSI